MLCFHEIVINIDFQNNPAKFLLVFACYGVHIIVIARILPFAKPAVTKLIQIQGSLSIASLKLNYRSEIHLLSASV